MGRTPCCDKAHTNKGAWTKEEDQRLITYIGAYGEGSWRTLPTSAGLLRCGKSCRLRWINYLRPDLKRGNFTEEEDELIIKLHGLFGNKWSLIASRLPGRTDNEIKNYWNTRIKRKLLDHGIDPQTHRPINSATRPPVLVNPTADRFATTDITKLDELDERSHSEGSSSASCSIDLNLDLSIVSLPHSSVDDTPLTHSVSTSTMTTKMAATPAICLCYSLGFRGSEECGCQAVQEQQAVIRYCSSIEIEPRNYFS